MITMTTMKMTNPCTKKLRSKMRKRGMDTKSNLKGANALT